MIDAFAVLDRLAVIKKALGDPPADEQRRCVYCKPIVEALLLLNELERKLKA
jgi:hypothetical protein